MAARPVITIGNPLLRDVARDLDEEEFRGGDVRRLAADLVDTMRKEGGIGIAAPQIGESVQLAIIEISDTSQRYPDMSPFDLEVFINPKISVVDETEQGFWEGCLSVPDLRGLVYRPRAVRVDYLGLDGDARTLEAEGFLATVVQHELDHLQGILFVDRIRDTTKLATLEDYRRFWLGQPRGEA